jgi:tellurite resistance protein TerC
MRRILKAGAKSAWRAVIAVIGVSVILFGVILFFTPGPAILVIPLGLSILATEFVWAGRLLRNVRDSAKSLLPQRRDPKT